MLILYFFLYLKLAENSFTQIINRIINLFCKMSVLCSIL
jgi:hypothetical protein